MWGDVLGRLTRTVSLADVPPAEVLAVALATGDARGVEVKCVGLQAARRWGNTADTADIDDCTLSDAVPPEVFVQTQCQMMLLGERVEVVDVPALIGTDLRVYRVERDNTAIANLVKIGVAFWTEHVLTRTPPRIEGHNAGEILRAMYPRHSDVLREATPEEAALVERYAKAAEFVRTAEADKDEVKAALCAAIADAAGLQFGKSRATWKTQAGRTDYKTLAEALADAIKAILFYQADAKALPVALSGAQALLDCEPPKTNESRVLRVTYKEV